MRTKSRVLGGIAGAAVALVCGVGAAQVTTQGFNAGTQAHATGVQPKVTLPEWSAASAANGATGMEERFSFATDGPKAAGWGARPDEVARVYLERALPAFFSRTLTLERAIPAGGTLEWIFTGEHGGFTVELTSDSVHVVQRYYDSFGLREPDAKGTYPVKAVEDVTVPYAGTATALTVELDAKLQVHVMVNGMQVAQQMCLQDMERDQLALAGLRTVHDVVAGRIVAAAAGTTAVRVDTAKRFQTIVGFGGSPSISAYDSLSETGKAHYWELLRRYNLLIDREYPMGTQLKPDMSNLDDVADSTPHYYGDNFPNSEVTSFAYNAMALKLGGKVLYEMWALPAWATKDYTDPEGKLHKGAANVPEWARAMLTYTKLEKAKTGKAPDILGIENEVTQPQEIVHEMVRTLRAELDKAGFASVKIQMPDASTVPAGITAAKTLREDAKAWSEIDYAASHEYDFQRSFTDPDGYDKTLAELRAADGDKPFLTTELSVNSAAYQMASYRIAFQMGQLYYKNMTIMDSVGILYCWTILDTEQPNFPASRGLIALDRTHGNDAVASSFQLRVLGSFSRRVLEGMVRVEATSTNPDVLVTAYVDGKGGKTLVALNRSLTPQVLDISGGGAWSGKGMQVERTSQYAENVVEAAPERVTVQPGEIVTLSSVAAAK